MATPDLRVYFWGKSSPTTAAPADQYRWWRAGYSLLGGSGDLPGGTYQEDCPAGQYVISFPTALFGVKWLSMTSDQSVASELYPFTSIPIVIVNEGTAPAEEVNLFIGDHFWSRGEVGEASSEGEFAAWWGMYKDTNFKVGAAWTDSNGNTIPADESYNDQHANADAHMIRTAAGAVVSELGYGDGWRYDKMAQSVNHVPYDTEGSDFRTNPAYVWNRNAMAFCPLQDGAAWGTYSQALTDDPALLKTVLGDPTTVNTAWGAYASYYNTTLPWKQQDCLLRYFGNAPDVRYDAAQMGQRWGDHLNSGVENELGRKTLHRAGLFTTYSGVNYAYWQPRRIMRGFLLASLYGDGFDGGRTLPQGREGKVYGKHFCTVGLTARYYE